MLAMTLPLNAHSEDLAPHAGPHAASRAAVTHDADHTWERGFRDGYDARDAEVRQLRALQYTPRPAATIEDAMAILVAHGWRDLQLAVLLDGMRNLRRCVVAPTIDRMDVSR